MWARRVEGSGQGWAEPACQGKWVMLAWRQAACEGKVSLSYRRASGWSWDAERGLGVECLKIGCETRGKEPF